MEIEFNKWGCAYLSFQGICISFDSYSVNGRETAAYLSKDNQHMATLSGDAFSVFFEIMGRNNFKLME